jgi:hypothetical protein
MIRVLASASMLAAALLFAGDAWAADFTCEGTAAQCAEILRQSGLLPKSDSGIAVKDLATKGDIDAINKRMDTIEHLLLVLCSHDMAGFTCEIRRD